MNIIELILVGSGCCTIIPQLRVEPRSSWIISGTTFEHKRIEPLSPDMLESTLVFYTESVWSKKGAISSAVDSTQINRVEIEVEI